MAIGDSIGIHVMPSFAFLDVRHTFAEDATTVIQLGV